MSQRKQKAEERPTIQEAVYYVRVSSQEQQETGFSIPAQIKAAQAYAEAHGLKVSKEFVDVESAKKSGRQQFEQMCTFLKRSKTCKVVIVEKTDRLYRNIKDWVAIDDLMSERGLAIHLYKENSILSKESRSHEKFIHGIKVLMAKNYIDNLSEEVKKGMTEKAIQGHYPGRAPLGYLNNTVTKTIELDPDRAPMIKRFFELYATGDYSLNDLHDLAKKEGLTYLSGRSIVRATIHQILDNPIYYGSFLMRGTLYQGKHTAIISPELFAKVQDIKNGRHGGVNQNREFAFTGLLTCGHCGCQVTAEIKKGKYIYYHCTGYKGKCPEKYLREEELDKKLGMLIADLHIDDRIFETLRLALKDSLKDEKAFHEEAVGRLQGQETKTINRLKQLYLDKLDGTIDLGVYQELKMDMDGELDRIRKQLAAHQKADKKYLESGIQFLELAQTAYSSYSQRSPHEKRKLLNYVLSNCILKDGQLIPTYRKPFDLIASAASMSTKGKRPDTSDQASSSFWLPMMESNHRQMIQNHLYYHYTNRD